MTNYSSLSRAQLSYDYLHTNSTTHEFLFGALAELVDNARDAAATQISINAVPNDSLRGGYMLGFLDDGEGMAPDEAADIITFGKSSKKSQEANLIGMYGNGLKSGSMRIGNDFILFTKKGPSMTLVFLSRSFHEEEDIDEIVVPMPSFESTTKKPLAKSVKDKDRHKLEMDIILKYSPFKTEEELMKEFDRIEGNSGTLVIIYNMKLLDSGEPELDVKTEPHDIILSNPNTEGYDSDEGLMPERKSFRAYLSILYAEPRMKIYLKGKKVGTRRLASILYKPRSYKFSSNRFKTRSENEARKAQEEHKAADFKAREAESKYRDLENKMGSSQKRDQRAELRKAQTLANELRQEAQLKKQIADRKVRSLKDPKSLNFIFGTNLENRSQDGLFFYNCNRLIKMYQKAGPQAENGETCKGVLGIVDIPYLVLEPTHNKQDFADAKEYRLLQRAMGEHLMQYWKDSGIPQQGVSAFWENFGYSSSNWRDPPSQDPKFVRKRAMQLPQCVQCNLCLKWRILPFSANNIGKEFPEDWICSSNPDPGHNRCSAAEQKMTIQEGVLKKEVKSKEQKEKELEEEIRKKQEKLDKMMKHKTVKSSREMKDVKEEERASRRGSSRHSRREPTPSSEEEEEEEESEEEEPPKKLAKKSPAYSASSKRSSTSGKKSRVVRRPTTSEEEEEEEEPPRKRSAKTVKPSPRGSLTSSKKSATPARRPPRSRREVESESEEEEEEEEEETKPSAKASPTRTQKGRAKKEEKTSKDKEKTQIEADNGEVSEEGEEEVSVGTKVEAKVQNKWCSGKVTEVDTKQRRWKVKLDKNAGGRSERWFFRDGGEVRLAGEKDGEVPASPTSLSSHEPSAEMPTSSTGGQVGPAQAVFTEDIANGYRTCLRYFLPPQWVMDKDAVSTLTIQELASFPLDDFFDHYEKGLRKLVSSFQLEANKQQQEAEAAGAKLCTVRKMIAKLLKSINEEFDIDPEADTEQVDELLAACVKQALEQGDSSA